MKDVVISGVGTLNSIGRNLEEVWDGLLTGRSGLKDITLFDTSEHPQKRGCEISELRKTNLLTDSNQVGRVTQILLAALEDALEDAGLSLDDLSTMKVGLCVGTTMGEFDTFETVMRGQPSQMEGGPHVIGEQVSKLLGLKGPLWTITNACAAGNLAIARSMDELNAERADVMIAVGVDSISWVAFTGFNSLRAMAPEFCQPFDVNRKGMMLGEGAGVVILESRKQLEMRKEQSRRPVRARARLLGYGMSCDAHHITQPDPFAHGAIRSMEMALAMAEVSAGQISYVSAHGTGTPANDLMEAKALRTVFKDDVDQVHVSSIKGHIGHTLGAASLIEAVICVKALETGILPPTLHLKEVDPECAIQVIANVPLRKDVRYILSNAYAFGGINSSIVLAKVDK